MPTRSLLLFTLLEFALHPVAAQRVEGRFSNKGAAPRQVLLQEVRGGDAIAIDSVPVGRKGQFAFQAQQRPAGFYRLVAGNEDVLDLILDPREPLVVLGFDGTPLQEHVTVKRSAENMRLWEYKRASRHAQQQLATLNSEIDLRAHPERGPEYQERRNAILAQQEVLMERLLLQDTTSTFHYLVRSDQQLDDAFAQGRPAHAASLGWSDGRLLRSSVYPRAVMAYLRSAPEPMVEELMASADSLLAWAAPNLECWRYMRSLLFRVFQHYGPEMAAQHIVDRTMSGPGALLPVEPELAALARDLMRVSVGAPAPDVPLEDPATGTRVMLSSRWPEAKATVLFFYSSTCDHCHAEMPGLKALHAEKRGAGLQVLGIALDADREEFLTALEALGLPWPSYSELNGWGSAAAKAFAVKATPTFVVIDANGIIAAKPYDHLELREQLERLLR